MRSHKHIEQAGEAMNQGCVILLWLAFFTAVFMYNRPAPTYTEHRQTVAAHDTELDYTLAIATSRKGSNPTAREMREMDEAANNATPEHCRHTLKCDAFVAAGF